jgi:rhodanese-related sulfurtransferase
MKPWWSPFGQVPEISAGELHERLAHGAKIQLLDVRTRREFAHGHIAGAVNVPIQSFRGQLPLLGLDGSPIAGDGGPVPVGAPRPSPGPASPCGTASR